MGEAAVLGLLLATARIRDANVRSNEDVWRTRVAFGRQPGSVEKLCDSRSIEDLTDARDITGSRRLLFQLAHHILRGAVAVQPEQRDVVLGRPDAVRIKG